MYFYLETNWNVIWCSPIDVRDLDFFEWMWSSIIQEGLTTNDSSLKWLFLDETGIEYELRTKCNCINKFTGKQKDNHTLQDLSLSITRWLRHYAIFTVKIYPSVDHLITCKQTSAAWPCLTQQVSFSAYNPVGAAQIKFADSPHFQVTLLGEATSQITCLTV